MPLQPYVFNDLLFAYLFRLNWMLVFMIVRELNAVPPWTINMFSFTLYSRALSINKSNILY